MKEHSSPRTSAALAWGIFTFFLLFCTARMIAVVWMYDIAYAKQVLFPSSFGVEMTLIILHSVIFIFCMPEDSPPGSLFAPVMNTLLGYYIVRFCYTCIMGSFIFTALFRLLLLYFPFSGFLYTSALVLTIGIVLSLLRMASLFYSYRIKQSSRK